MSHQHRSRSDLEALFPETILTVPTVAERLGRHEVTIIRALRRGELEALLGLGRPYLMTRSAVIAWALGERGDDTAALSADAPAPTPEPDADSRPVSDAAIIRRRSMTPKRKAA